jgi:hypothetical protein
MTPEERQQWVNLRIALDALWEEIIKALRLRQIVEALNKVLTRS